MQRASVLPLPLHGSSQRHSEGDTLRLAAPHEGRLCVDGREALGLAVQVLLEPPHLVERAVADLQYRLVISADAYIWDAPPDVMSHRTCCVLQWRGRRCWTGCITVSSVAGGFKRTEGWSGEGVESHLGALVILLDRDVQRGDALAVGAAVPASFLDLRPIEVSSQMQNSCYTCGAYLFGLSHALQAIHACWES